MPVLLSDLAKKISLKKHFMLLIPTEKSLPISEMQSVLTMSQHSLTCGDRKNLAAGLPLFSYPRHSWIHDH